MANRNQKLRLGTRGSLLALSQSKLVADQLSALHRGLMVELITIRTTGDRVIDRPLHDVGGKGLFTKELEQALLRGEIDFAVHSFKDVPTTMPLVDQAELMTAAVPVREDPRDVLVSSVARSIQELPPNARVGTGSLRRRCQLLRVRPDLRIEPIRGNIDTRMKKLRAGEFDAVVLALAGIKRARLVDEAICHPIPVEELLPAPGQGALCLQCRKDDLRTVQLLAALNHVESAACVALERKVVEILEGDCHSPIAALAVPRAEGGVWLRVAVGAQGGGLPVKVAESSGEAIADLSVASKACLALGLGTKAS
jgi:hydroxymethylbilane synthase